MDQFTCAEVMSELQVRIALTNGLEFCDKANIAALIFQLQQFLSEES